MPRFSLRKLVSIAIFLLVVLVGFPQAEEIRIGGILLKSNAQTPLIKPKLSRLYQEIPSDSALKVWVFFTDKGIFTEKDYQKTIQDCRLKANPRVIRRMELRSEKKDFDFTDIPVAEEYVKKIEEMGFVIKTKSKWLNAVTLYANREQVELLSKLPFVKSIDKVARYKRIEPEVAELSLAKPYATPEGTLLDYGLSCYPQLAQINVPALHNLGYNGLGVLVCMMDVGFRKDHPAFATAFAENRVIAEHDFINNDNNTQNEPGDQPGQDTHGTYTWSALGGEVEGQLYGPAYKASFLLAKTEDVSAEYQLEEDYWVAGAEWADGLGADIISSSLGYHDWYTYADMDGNTAITTIAADLAASEGILVVNAAGNERQFCSDGPPNPPYCWFYIIAPADGDSVLSVAAVDLNRSIAYFSSSGFSPSSPLWNGRIKPDVAACGVGTYCAVPGGGYGRVSGTSLSTPLVAGASAILFQAFWEKDSTIGPMDVIDSLKTHASRADSCDTLYGCGVIDAYASAGFSQIDPYAKLTAHPNPFSRIVIIFAEANQNDEVQVSIHTVAGEMLVKELPFAYVRHADKYGYEMLWNSKNEKNEEVADGIYLVNVRIGDKSRIVKVAKVSK
ncbi:MAG: S8 family serine peptidase [candidate division Zixibacteria bacterium]|nr:S8 family serine peptidase [candidate division Zixibacteria bacterium]